MVKCGEFYMDQNESYVSDRWKANKYVGSIKVIGAKTEVPT